VNRFYGKVAVAIIGAGALLACGSARAAPPAETAICASCHGSAGMGNASAGFPTLAGLPASYLAAQIAAFQKGMRANPIMSGAVAGLTIGQITAIADYYAALPVLQSPEPTPLPGGLGAVLAVDGDWNHSTAGIPACDSCHGPYGLGVGSTVPRLAGQPSAYIVAQLGAWQKNNRQGDPQGLMKRVADELNADQINAVAAYYAALSPNPPTLPKPAAAEARQ
jgi:cytochrome c553